VQTAGLTDAHCWDNVVDFRWHRMSQSPNWSIIPESDRRIDDVFLNPTNDNSSVFKWEHIGSARVVPVEFPQSTETQGSLPNDSAGDSEDEI
jgi:hypothetical protein